MSVRSSSDSDITAIEMKQMSLTYNNKQKTLKSWEESDWPIHLDSLLTNWLVPSTVELNVCLSLSDLTALLSDW